MFVIGDIVTLKDSLENSDIDYLCGYDARIIDKWHGLYTIEIVCPWYVDEPENTNPKIIEDLSPNALEFV